MKKWIFAFTILLVVTSSACNPVNDLIFSPPHSGKAGKAAASLHVDIINSEGVQIGKAMLTEAAQEVRIQLIAEKLEPGQKAIHIHETGKCEKPDFKTAGAYCNPYRKEHGFHNLKGDHAEETCL